MVILGFKNSFTPKRGFILTQFLPRKEHKLNY